MTKIKTMHELLTFKQARIDALLSEQASLKQRISELETYLFELCDPNCPEEYKRVVLSEIYSNNDLN